jgi:4-amino-4-deoxy-L-arabinose transferase-like glycosyltransferase
MTAGNCTGLPFWLAAVWRYRVALAVIAALAGLLYAWAMSRAGLEYYYAAADRSMATSWHDFAFGAFDPAGTLTVDKLPGALWLQALSARVFGLHAWSIVLPQVIEGVLTVLALYRAVRRLAGPAAGLVSALVLASSPATVALNRENISDSLLILLLVLSADAVSAAIAGPARARPDGQPGLGVKDRAGQARPGRTLGWLILAGVWVGLAFQAKEIEAWMVLPALGLAYLVSAPGTLGRRAGRLAVMAAVGVVVSVSWMTAISLVPAAHRPYVDGSHDNSVFEQVFTYNGLGRFGDQTPIQVQAVQLDPGTAVRVPPRAPGRMLQGGLGRDAGWLIPAAAAVAAWGIASRRRKPRGDLLRASFLLWAGWLVTFFAVFSAVTFLQPYYTAALSPPVAAIIGTGFVAARARDQVPTGVTLGVAAIVAGTVGYAGWLASSSARAPGWLLPTLIAAGAAGTVVVLWPLARRRSVPLHAALLAGLAAIVLTPAVASVSLAAHGEGAFDTPFESAQAQETTAISTGTEAILTIPQLIPSWQSLSDRTRYLMAAQSIGLSSLIIYDSGLEALPIGGYDGTTPSPTLAQMQADVRHGLFRLVWIASATSPRLRWVTGHCARLTERLYDCGTGRTRLPQAHPPPAPEPASGPAT